MAEDIRKRVKLGVKKGGGPPPGYRWNVLIPDNVHADAMRILNKVQYQHVSGLFHELAKEADPTHCNTLSIDALEEFHELREKGGVLNGLNLRVFFLVDKVKSNLVILGVIKKSNDGPTLPRDKIAPRFRRRQYLSGELTWP